jgi:hypothetical protein
LRSASKNDVASHDEIRRIKARYGRQIMSKPGVAGVGIEKDAGGEYELVVHLDDDAARANVPEELEGQKVRFVKSGPFRKLQER